MSSSYSAFLFSFFFNPHTENFTTTKTASNNNNKQWRTIASRERWMWMVGAECEFGMTKMCPSYLDHNHNDQWLEQWSIEMQLVRWTAIFPSLLDWWTFYNFFSPLYTYTLDSQQIKSDFSLIIKTLSSIYFALYVKTSAGIA